MNSNTRRGQLLDELANSSGRVRVDMLADQFAVSERTVRYDLRFLEARGVRFDIKPGRSGGIQLVSVPDDLQLRSDRFAFSHRTFGYQAESAAIDRLLAAVHRGTGSIVVVSGEAGIGKTRLCRRSVEKVEGDSFSVFSATAQETGSGSPLRPWVRLINHLVAHHSRSDTLLSLHAASMLRALAHSLPEIEIIARPGLELGESIPRSSNELIDAVSETVIELTRGEPTLFLFDDIQWADSQSLEVLLNLSDLCYSSHLMVLATARTPMLAAAPDALSSLLSLRETGLGLTRVELRGLDYVESGQLLATLTDVPESDPRFDEMLRISKGNPLFIRELALHNSRMDSTSDRVELPSALDGAIAERLAPLSKECQLVLKSASVVGSEFAVQLLESVTDVPSEDLNEPLSEALKYQVIEHTDASRTRYRFSHPLIYQHIYSSLRLEDRQKLHSKLANFLLETRQEDDGRDQAQILHHLLESGPNAERSRVAEYAIEVGERELESFTFQSAADHFQIAIELSEEDAVYGRACKGMARASTSLDNPQSVQRWNSEAIPALLKAGDLHRAIEAAQLGGTLSNPRMAIDLAEMVLAAVPHDFPGRAGPLATLGWMQAWVVDEYDFESASRNLEEAIRIAEEEGDDVIKCIALGRLTQIKYLNMNMAACLTIALDGLDLARKLRLPEREVHFLDFVVQANFEMGDLKSAASHATAMNEPSERSGSVFRVRVANWANMSIQHALSHGMSMDQVYRETSEHLAQTPLACLAVGTTEEQSPTADNVVSQFRRSLPFTVRTTSQTASTPDVLASIASVFEDSSLLRFDRPLHPFEPFPKDSPISLRNRLIAVGLSAAIDGDVDASKWAYQQLVSGSLVPEQDSRSAPIEQALGVIAAGSGEHDQAFDHFSSAIEKAKTSGFFPTMAWSLIHGLRSAAEGGLRSGAASLAKWIPPVRSFASEQGLELISNRLDDAIAEVESIWPSSLTADFGLTSREMEVLRLIANGFTNDQIAGSLVISASTVASHVESILSKTSSRNRVEAARLVHQLTVSAPDQLSN